METPYTSVRRLSEFSLWNKRIASKKILAFTLELTTRCNNNCRHCYINTPADDPAAQEQELSFDQIRTIIDQAAELGILWCLLSGGEPLVRDDFPEIYEYLIKKGFLVSVFTNATLIRQQHIDLFKKYPPRDIEITVYGVREDTYERVSRTPGSYQAFMRGLDLLTRNEIEVRLKAMAMRSNVHELDDISSFCRIRTKDHYRFDPFLNLRYDRDEQRNKDILHERLSPAEIVSIEQNDDPRRESLKSHCDALITETTCTCDDAYLFRCGAGVGSFSISPDGMLRLCSALVHPDCVYDLKQGSLAEAISEHIPVVRKMRMASREFERKCHSCGIINLCMHCPAHAFLETGRMNTPSEYFCEVAKSRKSAICYST